MSRGAARLNRRGTEPRHCCVCLEPAAMGDAVIEQRYQDRMPKIRERAAQRIARSFAARIELRDGNPHGLSRCEVHRSAIVAEEAFRKQARHPGGAQCKTIARDVLGAIPASTRAVGSEVRRNFV